MVDLGQTLKSVRKNKGLSQKQLCENICSQAMISQVEKNQKMPGADVLYALCKRLDITVESLFNDDDTEIKAFFDQLRKLSFKQDYNKILEVINASDLINRLQSPLDLQLYYYYLGCTSLIAKKKYDESIFYFRYALDLTSGNQEDKKYFQQELLILNAIATTYYESGNLKKAELMYKDILAAVPHMIGGAEPREISKIYFNIAKFYSDKKNYKQASNICKAGIDWIKNYNSTFGLAQLYYELGFNEYHLQLLDEAKNHYNMAKFFAEHGNIQHVLDTIASDIKLYPELA